MTDGDANPMNARFRSPRCGARNRAGEPCKAPALRGRPRCRLHGGHSPGAPQGERNGAWKHGRRSERLKEAKAVVRACSRSVVAEDLEPSGRRSRVKVAPLAELEALYEAKGPQAIRTLRERDPGAYLAALVRVLAE